MRQDCEVKEHWVDIKNHPNHEVSNFGNIRNKKTGRILKQQTNSKGYKHLTIDGKGERVNRIVADSFFDGDHNGLDVDHLDGNKSNNFIGNLDFCTRSENIRRAFAKGLSKSNLNDQLRRKGTERMKEVTSKAVRVVETNAIYPSLKECARQTGCYPSEIAKCCRGEMHQHHGLHFEFV